MFIILRLIIPLLIFTSNCLAENTLSIHQNFWKNHQEYSNEIIKLTLTQKPLSIKEYSNNYSVSYSLCTKIQKRCVQLHFDYYFEPVEQHGKKGKCLVRLFITLTTVEGKLLWYRDTEFYIHDALDAIRSWPHYVIERLYDGSEKKTYYECTYGYEHCSETTTYNFSDFDIVIDSKSIGSKWAIKELQRWKKSKISR